MNGRRSSIAIAILLPVLLKFAGGTGVALERPKVEQTAELFVVRVKGPFSEVLVALEAAIARHNYFLAGTNNLDDTLRRRAADLGGPFDFDHYKILSFCNLTLADEALKAHPYVGAFMPCRLAVFVPRGSPNVIIVTMRPTFLARVFKSSEIQRLASRVEADVLAILEMVAAD
jgi:uncharacterized protein (DUF302 family)